MFLFYVAHNADSPISPNHRCDSSCAARVQCTDVVARDMYSIYSLKSRYPSRLRRDIAVLIIITRPTLVDELKLGKGLQAAIAWQHASLTVKIQGTLMLLDQKDKKKVIRCIDANSTHECGAEFTCFKDL